MTARMTLTPQMAEYEQKFTDSGEVRWLPYLMYFHPTEHRSPVVNTDLAGFRYSESLTTRYSVIDSGQSSGSVRLLAGSSTVFGIGASSDSWTLSSRLTRNDSRGQRWINFGGRSFNSTQELLLFTLNKHHLPKVDEIVLFPGSTTLVWRASLRNIAASTVHFSTVISFSTHWPPHNRLPAPGACRTCLARLRRPSHRHRNPCRSRSIMPPT